MSDDPNAWRKKAVIRSDGKFYESQKAAAEDLGVCQSSVSHVLHGRIGSIKGYTFTFLDPKDKETFRWPMFRRQMWGRKKSNWYTLRREEFTDAQLRVYWARKRSRERRKAKAAEMSFI